MKICFFKFVFQKIYSFHEHPFRSKILLMLIELNPKDIFVNTSDILHRYVDDLTIYPHVSPSSGLTAAVITMLVVYCLFIILALYYLYFNRDLPGMPKYRTPLSLILSGAILTIFGRLIPIIFRNDTGCVFYSFLHSFGLTFSFSPYFVSNFLLFLEIKHRTSQTTIVYRSQNQLLIFICSFITSITLVYIVLRLYFAHVKYTYSMTYKGDDNVIYTYEWCKTEFRDNIFKIIDNVISIPLYVLGILFDKLNGNSSGISFFSNLFSVVMLCGFYVIEILPFNLRVEMVALYCIYYILSPFLLISSVLLLIYPRIRKMRDIRYKNLTSSVTV